MVTLGQSDKSRNQDKMNVEAIAFFCRYFDHAGIKYVIESDGFSFGDVNYFKTKFAPPTDVPSKWNENYKKECQNLIEFMKMADYKSLGIGQSLIINIRDCGANATNENLVRARKVASTQLRRIFGNGSYAAKISSNRIIATRFK